MGIEIDKTDFQKEDFQCFREQLEKETNLLTELYKNEKVEKIDTPVLGLEVEAWLTDENFVPSPSSCEYLEKLNNELVVPEISRFNFELNGTPQKITKNCLFKSNEELTSTWQACHKQAQKMGLNIITIGTLPTLRDHMLSLDYISPQKRYAALNEQIMKARNQDPVVVSIQGRDEVFKKHYDVLMESAATSMQIHFQPRLADFNRYYNASMILSPLLIAASANSPYLFGKQVWSESRIPLFEQTVDTPCLGNHRRVGFGKSYLENSLLDLFKENLLYFPPLLPLKHQTSPEKLKHLCLHNGTVYRWNRPIIGLNENNELNFRIEQRCPASGPTIIDMQANIALFLGLIEYLAKMETPPEILLPFEECEKNFYQCSQWGLDANVTWLNGENINVQKLLVQLLPNIKEGLHSLGIDSNEIYEYIDLVIEPRLLSGNNGANWQKAFIHTHGRRFQDMMEVYYEYQTNNEPVHTWTV